MPVAGDDTPLINADAVAQTVVRDTPAPANGTVARTVGHNARHPVGARVNRPVTGNKIQRAVVGPVGLGQKTPLRPRSPK